MCFIAQTAQNNSHSNIEIFLQSVSFSIRFVYSLVYNLVIFGETLNPADLLSTRGSDHGGGALSPRRADSGEVAAVCERRPEPLRPPPGSGSQEAAGQVERRRHAGPAAQVSAQRGGCLFRHEIYL